MRTSIAISFASALCFALRVGDASAAATHLASLSAASKSPANMGMTMISKSPSRDRHPGAIYGAVANSSSTGTTISDALDAIYTVQIELGGQTFNVIADTGSSDLWVIANGAPIRFTNTSDISAIEAYGAGVANGTVHFAELKLDSFVVPSQAFLLADTAVGFSMVDAGIASGILGLAFENEELSAINFGVKTAFKDQTSTLGATPINNILISNPNISNSFDVLLGRTGDLNDTNDGTLVIGNHAPGFADIINQPRLPRVTSGRWSIPSDGMHVNGKSFQFNRSSVSGLKPGQFAAALDTGYTFPPLPPAAVDFIYGSISRAVYTDTTFPQWLVPCTATVSLTFTFGGVQFPVHPLDITTVDSMIPPGKNTTVTYCHNTFQYIDLDPTGFSGFDAVLGDAFLRNVCASFNYGPSEATADGAYIQLLPITDPKTAHSDFLASRRNALATLPPEVSPSQLLELFGGSEDSESISSAIDASSASTDNSSNQLYSFVKAHTPIVVGLLAANVIVSTLLLVVGVGACLKGVNSSRPRTRSVNATYTPVRVKDTAEEYA